jgi:2-C-methyl-D-erythritol 2,4-cyclodiphosphate synthase
VAEQLFGLGFDVHPRQVGRPLFLGGVRFEGETGLAGHSDGDAVCHAVADGVLGAAGLGDIGEHFPDTDPRTAGIEGMELLARTVAKVRVRNLFPWSVDVTVIADKPAIAPRREEMRKKLASTLSVPVERVSVKASRPEGLGLSGDGAACLALVVLNVG